MKYSICLLFTILYILPVHSSAQSTTKKQRKKDWRPIVTQRIAESNPQIDSLLELNIDQLTAYCDSVEEATGWMPDLYTNGRHYKFIADSLFSKLFRRYNHYYTDSFGMQRWFGTDSKFFSKIRHETPIEYFDKNPKTSIELVWPQPLKQDSVEVQIFAFKNYYLATMSVSNLGSEKIAELWKGKLLKGSNTLNMKIGVLPKGKFLLILKDEKGNILASKRLLVQR